MQKARPSLLKWSIAAAALVAGGGFAWYAKANLLPPPAFNGFSARDDVQLENLYRHLVTKRRQNPLRTKKEEIYELFDQVRQRISQNRAATRDDALTLAAAMAALEVVGGIVSSDADQFVPLAIARFKEEDRAKWKPEARRIWLQAFHYGRVTTRQMHRQIAQLGKEGADVSTLEAIAALHYDSSPKRGDAFVERALAFSDAHPEDYRTIQAAFFGLYASSLPEFRDGKPIRTDLVERVLALEARATANYNAKLNDHVDGKGNFDPLRRRVAGLE